MDGFKKRLNESIQFKLSFWLSLSILLTALLAGAFSFFTAFEEAHELQDDMLRQMAAVLDHQNLPDSLTDLTREIDEDSRVTLQYLTPGETTSGDTDNKNIFPIPLSFSDGMHTVKAGQEEFRIYIRTLRSGQRIALSQETGIRNEIAQHSALRTTMPLLILVPILLLLLARLIQQTFKPVLVLSGDIDARKEHDLHPLEPQAIPMEIRPFVIAINRMLTRVEFAMLTQTRFVADAAHELRSPLTAISLQAERLAAADMSDEGKQRLSTLREGILRAQNLLNQLLTLAKFQTVETASRHPVSVQQLFKNVLEGLMPLAEARHIDIGVEPYTIDDERLIFVDEISLNTILKNLVDNAIRYTPEYGKVDLSAIFETDRIILQITDNGPGIPVNERVRICDPFYRIAGNEVSGAGLGLSIVKTIAERIGATLEFRYTDEVKKSGLHVNLILPQQRSD